MDLNRDAVGRAVVAISHCTKRYGGVVALNDVSLEIYPSEILCLVGENGAGKSTLAGLLAGFHEADEGGVFVDGEAVHFSRPSQAYAAGIRIVPQELMICPERDIVDNVLLGHQPTSKFGFISRRVARAQVQERLARLGLNHFQLSQLAGTLSIVDQAFIQIARALTPGARILIADEPTSPMSSAEVDRLLALFHRISDSGVAIIFVSHRTDEVLQLANRVLVLRDGNLVAELKQEDVSKEKLMKAMLGDKEFQRSQTFVADDAPVRLQADHIETTSLHDVSLRVRAGEIVGVYGIAGSGRDELGPAIFGASSRSGGDVVVDGVGVTPGNPRASIAKGLGYVPAERRTAGLILENSIRVNLTLACLSKFQSRGFLSKHREKDVVESWLQRLRIKSDSLEAPVGSLSGGTQQKVLLARWLVAGCSILVLDEPTRGVDIATKAEIYNLLTEIAREGGSVLVISSDIEEIPKVCDRAIVLRSGNVVAEIDSPTELSLLSYALSSTEVESNV
jgi:ABC-type sugar transport system ATPase subunit